MSPEYKAQIVFRRNSSRPTPVSLQIEAALGGILGEDSLRKMDMTSVRVVDIHFSADDRETALDTIGKTIEDGAFSAMRGYSFAKLRFGKSAGSRIEGPVFEYPPQLTVSEERVRKLDMFAQIFRPGPVAYYPGSSLDVSPLVTPGFKGSQIIYLDQNEEIVETLRQAGAQAYAGDVGEFDPGEVDTLLYLGFFHPNALQYVKEGGYAILDTKFPSKADLAGFRLIGVMDYDFRTNRPVFGTSNLTRFEEGSKKAGMYILKKTDQVPQQAEVYSENSEEEEEKTSVIFTGISVATVLEDEKGKKDMAIVDDDFFVQ